MRIDIGEPKPPKDEDWWYKDDKWYKDLVKSNEKRAKKKEQDNYSLALTIILAIILVVSCGIK